MKKHSKLLICMLAVTLVVAFMPTMAFAAGSTAKVKVTFGASSIAKANEFDFVTKEMEVSGDAAEKYGFADKESTDKVTFADVLYTAHAEKFGSKFTKNTAKNYIVVGDTGYLSKWFGVETFNVSYTYNHGLEMAGSAFDVIKNNTVISVYGYQDTTSYNDVDAWFVKDEITTTAGKSITLKMKGNGFDESYMSKTVDIVPASEKSIVAATVDKEGKLTAIKGGEMSADGKITLTFDKAGTYTVSACGKAKGIKANATSPISLAMAKVTVKAPAVGAVKGLKLKVKKGKKINAGWKAVKGAAGYEVSYAKKGAKKFTTKTVKTNKITLKKLKKGKKYVVKVKAFKKVGKEKYYGKEAKKTSKKVKK